MRDQVSGVPAEILLSRKELSVEVRLVDSVCPLERRAGLLDDLLYAGRPRFHCISRPRIPVSALKVISAHDPLDPEVEATTVNVIRFDGREELPYFLIREYERGFSINFLRHKTECRSASLEWRSRCVSTLYPHKSILSFVQILFASEGDCIT